MDSAPRRPRIVVSAVNLVEGGPLSVLTDCLEYAGQHLSGQYEIVALVHRAALVTAPNVRAVEFPAAKRSWLRRLYTEYWGFRDLSRELDAELWLSLHDISPTIQAHRRAVYCHNPAPFFHPGWRDAVRDPSLIAFYLFYGWLYRINIRQNDVVVVQQQWLAREFRARYRVSRVLVAHPDVPVPEMPALARHPGRVVRFIYPALPRTFKNIELLCEAARRLCARGSAPFEVLLSVRGDENRYARELLRRFGEIPVVRFMGRQTREEVFAWYASADSLVFPSKLETWGLPLTEFRPSGRPILASDLPYAHETLAGYGNAAFFAPDDPDQLADRMADVIGERLQAVTVPAIPAGSQEAAPVAHNWAELFARLLAEPGR